MYVFAFARVTLHLGAHDCVYVYFVSDMIVHASMYGRGLRRAGLRQATSRHTQLWSLYCLI